MASTSKQKSLWSRGTFQSRTTEERKAYRAKMRAELEAQWNSPEGRAKQEEINKAHAAWIAAGMPENT